jgi:hypothetical protein
MDSSPYSNNPSRSQLENSSFFIAAVNVACPFRKQLIVER